MFALTLLHRVSWQHTVASETLNRDWMKPKKFSCRICVNERLQSCEKC